MAHAVDNYTSTVKIALIGKYTGLQDSYLSVIKSLKHATMACDVDLEIIWVDACHLEHDPKGQSTDAIHDQANDDTISQEEQERLSAFAWEQIKNTDGGVVPGGFGNRGFNGKVKAAEYCRLNKKPFLGICLGFQAMVVEYCRNVMNWSDATSSEFSSDGKPVIMFMPEIDKVHMGGTMRLGSRATKFTHTVDESGPDSIPSISQCLYQLAPEHDMEGTNVIWERHRHRYEVNPEFVEEIHNHGLKFVGRDAETGTRMEVAELPSSQHPFYVGCQYHPEFQSRPLHPSPPFLGLIMASRDDGTLLKEHLLKAKAGLN